MRRNHSPIEIPLSGDGRLRGTLSTTGGLSRSAVVYVHGLGGHGGGEKAATLQQECERRGWTFLAFDFRGHGESTGTTKELTGSRLLEDLGAVQAYLKGQGVERLFLVGSSMGGWASAWFTQTAGTLVERCVLLAPAFRFLFRRWDQLPREELARWKESGSYRLQNEWIDIELGYDLILDRERYPATDLTRSWSRPVLIFHGVQDEVVPYPESLEFLTSTPCGAVELRLLNDGDHRLAKYKQEIASEACRWFESAWLS